MPEPKKFWFYALVNWLREPLWAVAFVLIGTSAIAQPFYIPSGSMEPTLAIGDYLFATKFSYGYSRYSLPLALGPASDHRLLQRMPARGDVVIFRPPHDMKVVYVKRVIGLPGDRIQMKAGRLFINGAEVAQRPDGQEAVESENGGRITAARYIETLPGGVSHAIDKLRDDGPFNDTGVYVVPQGTLFMMGDDRDNSLDSRVAAADGGVGYVPMENLIGKAALLLGSYDYLNAGMPPSPGALRLARFFQVIR
jgi:signal peptidase I